MSDRVHAEELLNRYSLAYDTADPETLGRCFTEDAVFSMQLPGKDLVSFETREGIVKLITDSLAAQTDQRRHINTNLIVTPRADGGFDTSHYLTLVATENGEIRLISAGIYRSRMVESGGELLIKSLHLDLDRPY